MTVRDPAQALSDAIKANNLDTLKEAIETARALSGFSPSALVLAQEHLNKLQNALAALKRAIDANANLAV